MSVPSVPAGRRFTLGDFRVGQVFTRTWSVLSRNLLTFVLVSALPSLPGPIGGLVLPESAPGADPFQNLGVLGVGIAVLLLFFVLQALVQAVLLYATFQVMRGRPIDLAESARIGLQRFFPIVGIAIIVPVLAGLASLFFVFPGLMLYTMWFVAAPVCVVEQLGPVDSMQRSRMLTEGHRWKIFGIFVLVSLIFACGEGVVAVMAGGDSPSGGLVNVSLPGGLTTLADIVNLIWNMVSTAFYAVLIVVTYHDLRVAKEGVDTNQIAAVFE